MMERGKETGYSPLRTATLERYNKSSLKTNHAATIQPRNCTSGHLLREMKTDLHKKSLQHYISFISKNPKLETTQCSLRGNCLHWYIPTMYPGQKKK